MDMNAKLDEMLKTKLYYIHSEHNFMPTTSFADTRISLSAQFGALTKYVVLSHIVDTTKLKTLFEVWKAKLEAAITTTRWSYDPNQTELESNLDIAEMIKPFCSRLILEDDNVQFKQAKGFVCCPIGIGSNATWHGSPDMRATGAVSPERAREESSTDVVILATEELLVDEEDYDSEGLNLEGKKNIFEDECGVLSQVAATTVVSAFTAHNNYKNINMAPVLLICKRRARVCFYDCMEDILLFSEIQPLQADEKINPVSLLIVWAMLHWRYVPQSCNWVHTFTTLGDQFQYHVDTRPMVSLVM